MNLTVPQNDPWAAERERYEAVQRLIERRIARLEPAASEDRSHVVELRRTFWDEVTVDNGTFDDMIESYYSVRQQAELLGERERAHRSAARELAALRRLREAPYFGFVAFRERGEHDVQPVYIGPFSLVDDDGESFLVYDWRAPVASLYYDYPPGEASYMTPGGTVAGDIERKLQFLSEGGALAGVFDSGVTIGDNLLAQMLARTSDARMKTIVSTIQREQNAAIRNDDKRLLVIHGPAGSGKTSAALQRVAYLLYKHRNTLRSEQMLLFSPNSMFMSYVDTVLPELGEEPIAQSTFADYVQHRLRRTFRLSHPFDELEAALMPRGEAAEERFDADRVKSDPAFLDAITAYVSGLNEFALPFRPIRLDGRTLIGREALSQAFAATDSSLPTGERLAGMRKAVLRELAALEAASVDEDWVSEAAETVDNDMLRKAYRETRRRQRGSAAAFNDRALEERILREMIANQRFEPLRRSVKRLRFIDYPKLYLQFLRTVRPHDPAWAQSADRTAEAFAQRTMPYEDAVPYLHLVDCAAGAPERRDVRHVFVDEAQDYSPLQLDYIKRLFPNARMTIVGDFRQAIFPFASALHDADAARRLYGGDPVEIVPFKRCYRSTRELVRFTRQLTADGGADIEPFDRPGEKPALVRAGAPDDVPAIIARDIRRLIADGFSTVAVVTKTAADAAEAFAKLQPLVEEAALATKETGHFPNGVCVLPAYLAKGVEFDAVLVWDASAQAYGRERERNLFYTACTRAMHRLRLYAAGEPSPFLRAADPDTYADLAEEQIGTGNDATFGKAASV